MTTDKELLKKADEYAEETIFYLDSDSVADFRRVEQKLNDAYLAGAEFQKYRWNEGVNVPDSEHEDGRHRDILILDKRSKVVFIGWYDAHLDCYFQCDENAAIKPETIKWQEIYLPE